MTEDAFKALCNTFGFAPSRALREMLDKAMEQEREVCAKVCETYEVASINNDAHNIAKIFNHCAAAIRARSNT